MILKVIKSFKFDDFLSNYDGYLILLVWNLSKKEPV